MKFIIELQNISKSFFIENRELKILKSISLAIKEAEFLAIMGPSGSGKSTLMNILGCLDLSSSGKYIFNQKCINNNSKNQLAEIRNKEIGFVFQNFNLIPYMNILQNVELPLLYTKATVQERRNRALKVIKLVGLIHRIEHHPSKISGGEKQRVAIARALINNPNILLIDEPTGNLDSESSDRIMHIFKELHEKGITIILITHEKHIADYANKIIYLKDGSIIKNEFY